MSNNSPERYIAANKGNYLNLVIDDFYISKGTLKVYQDIFPTLLSERYGLKIVVIYEQKILHGKNGRS